ncbi:acyl-CoA dehydrogenase [Streptomyces sp. CA-294286]|uniref:acyl-CoA dehydrogenase n=1 Tax=Streptomyces sp. CA-294286 TaxID=3240070 RepID=UPI003D92252B
MTAAAQAHESTNRFLLQSLCRLFLLQQLGEHTGDLLAAGRLTATHVQALPATLDTVVGDLVPHMMTLVDAFDLPTEMLDALPIANGDTVGRIVDEVLVHPGVSPAALRPSITD